MEFVEAALLTALHCPHQCADARVLAGSFPIRLATRIALWDLLPEQ